MTSTTSQRPSDSDLQEAVVEELCWIPSVDSAHIGVAVTDGAVTLSGEVVTYPEKALAEKATQRVRGVIAVADELTVRDDQGLATDSDIARTAGEALRHAVDVPDSVKVVVRHRVVTLSGAVAWHYEREAAARAVRSITGVRSVVDAVTIRPSVVAAGVKDAIGAALLRNAQVEGEHITVTTDDGGFVVLEGTVGSWAERRQAEHVSWSAPGVAGVTNNLVVGS